MADIKDPENTIIMTLKDGEVVIELLPDVAPKHSERMKHMPRDYMITLLSTGLVILLLFFRSVGRQGVCLLAASYLILMIPALVSLTHYLR